MRKKICVVLDTSIFVNPDSRFVFGNTPKEAFDNFLDELKGKQHISCHMPPSVYEELIKFIEKPITKKSILINKKPPSSYEASVPAMLVYELIEETRLRVNKGLRIAEKYSRRGLNTQSPPSREKEEEMIKSLRQEYRVALREGIIDSKEDFDLVLLAREINGYLTTSDKGLIKWAQKLGITCIGAQELKEVIQ